MKRKKKSVRKKAVALKYDRDKDSAPKVSAKGAGTVAEKIIELARERDIPIREDPDLVETLSGLDLDQEIPPELYHVIAEVLAWVYRINSKFGS